MGAKLFPAIVAQIREDAESLTILNKLNQLAHDYEDDVETAAGYLNDVHETSAVLCSYHQQATRFVRERVLTQDGD